MAIGHLAWDNAALLEQNRQRLLKEMGRRLREYEARYELSSDRLEEELAAGRIRETHEVCKWLVDLRAYRAMSHERPTRVE